MPRPSRNVDVLLLRAGREMFPSAGVRGLSVRKVAERAGDAREEHDEPGLDPFALTEEREAPLSATDPPEDEHADGAEEDDPSDGQERVTYTHFGVSLGGN